MDQRVRIKRVIEALNPRIFDEEKPLKVRGIAHLGMGWMHDNFLVTVNDRRLIFRISLLKGNKFAPGLKRAKEHITSEYNNTRRLQESGIAPKVYYKNISCREIDRPFLIIDYLEGKRIKRLSRKDIRRLALLLAKLHSMDRIPGLRNSNFDEAFLDWNRQRVERIANEEEYARFTNEGFKHELKKAYSRARGIRFNPIKPSIIHGDPAGENLLRVKEGVRLIDWEGVALGPPQRDIATVIDKEDLRAGRLSFFLSVYARNVKRSDALLQIREYLMQRCLQKLCLALSDAFKLKLGKPDAIEHLSLEYHLKNAHYEFRRCKELGLFPKTSILLTKF